MKAKEYIKKNKIKQKKMAKDLGITPGYLSGIIAGIRTPSLELARNIEKYLNYEVSRLELLYPDEDWDQVVKIPKSHNHAKLAPPSSIVSEGAKAKVLDIIKGSRK